MGKRTHFNIFENENLLRESKTMLQVEVWNDWCLLLRFFKEYIIFNLIHKYFVIQQPEERALTWKLLITVLSDE